MRKTEFILDTSDPNIKNVIRSVDGGGTETIKQITSTTGEEPDGDGQTKETITITRKYLGSTTES